MESMDGCGWLRPGYANDGGESGRVEPTNSSRRCGIYLRICGFVFGVLLVLISLCATSSVYIILSIYDKNYWLLALPLIIFLLFATCTSFQRVALQDEDEENERL